ncbi:hypothetical protein [Azospirillum sp. ST 5-10]|uniref:hypothetical protein n=1 Tax=unclassified Azospirillum TaxID=2630922 RepID=UPI003F4A37A4
MLPPDTDLYDLMFDEIAYAAAKGRPFSHTSPTRGVYAQSYRMAPMLRDKGRDTLQRIVAHLIATRRVVKDAQPPHYLRPAPATTKDKTMDTTTTHTTDDLLDLMADAINVALADGDPLGHTGIDGVYERRARLPVPIRHMARDELYNLVTTLLVTRRVEKEPATGRLRPAPPEETVKIATTEDFDPFEAMGQEIDKAYRAGRPFAQGYCEMGICAQRRRLPAELRALGCGALQWIVNKLIDIEDVEVDPRNPPALRHVEYADETEDQPMNATTSSSVEAYLAELMIEAIGAAMKQGKPMSRTGANGVYARQMELPFLLGMSPRAEIEAAVARLLAEGGVTNVVAARDSYLQPPAPRRRTADIALGCTSFGNPRRRCDEIRQ